MKKNNIYVQSCRSVLAAVSQFAGSGFLPTEPYRPADCEVYCLRGAIFFDTDYPVKNAVGEGASIVFNFQGGGGPAWHLLDLSRARCVCSFTRNACRSICNGAIVTALGRDDALGLVAAIGAGTLRIAPFRRLNGKVPNTEALSRVKAAIQKSAHQNLCKFCQIYACVKNATRRPAAQT